MCLEFGYSEPDAVAQHTESANPEHARTPSDHTRIRIGQAAGKVKSIHLSMRACRATTHAYCLKRQVTRVRYLHTKVFSRCSFRLTRPGSVDTSRRRGLGPPFAWRQFVSLRENKQYAAFLIISCKPATVAS